jgi:hypothetical protein
MIGGVDQPGPCGFPARFQRGRIRTARAIWFNGEARVAALDNPRGALHVQLHLATEGVGI